MYFSMRSLSSPKLDAASWDENRKPSLYTRTHTYTNTETNVATVKKVQMHAVWVESETAAQGVEGTDKACIVSTLSEV